MLISQTIILFGFAVGALDSRTVQLAARGGLAPQMAQRPFLIVLLGGLATPALISILVGGFFAFHYAIWLGVVIVGLIALARIVTPATFPVFYRISPYLNGLTIVAAVTFWGGYFGFIDLN